MALRADVPEDPVLIFDLETLKTHDGVNDHQHRTIDRDDAAVKVKEEIIDEDRWPVQMTELAEEFEWSRQHFSNVIKLYFKERGSEVDEQEEKKVSVYVKTDDLKKVDVPQDVDENSFIRGYVAALEEC